MSSKKSSSSFGPPRPLPGQAEYGKTKTDLLEREATEMEIKLRMLQERMADPKLMAATAVAAGGNRWKSASEDKGSFRSYARDLQEKHKKKMSATYDPSSAMATRMQQNTSSLSDHSSAAGSRTSALSNSSNRIHTAPADQWGTEDVGSWLAHLGLPQYSTTFSSNEISGPVLLDLSLSDLDYLKITILGHRKTIIKAVEEMKNNKGMAFPGGGSSSSGLAPAPAKSSTMRSADDMDAKKSTHWSNLEPLSSNPVCGGRSGFTNPADRDDEDIFDEAAEQAAFKEAVAEWRRSSSEAASSSSSSKPKVSIVRDANYEPSQASATKNGMWHNPFADPTPVPSDLFDDSGDEEEEVRAGAAASNSSTLRDGRLDEAEEHREFVKAVDAWRSGGAPATNAKILSLTEQVARQLESEQQQAEQRMAQQREEAYRKLEAYRSSKGSEGAGGRVYPEGAGGEDFMYTSRSDSKSYGDDNFIDFSDGDDDDDNDIYVEAAGAKAAGGAGSAQQRSVTVHSSSLGLPDAKDGGGAEEYYVVEESDDD